MSDASAHDSSATTSPTPTGDALVQVRRVEVPGTDRHVAVVRLNNGKVNALSSALLGALAAAAAELTVAPPGAVVITGGERIFAAGADISEFGGPSEGASIGARFHEALDAVAAIPRFVIAAVTGYALGGGCELALACDYRIAGTKAVFGQPEVLLGIIPGGGGTQRLPRLVGTSVAKEMMITGRQVRAEEALRLGLANELVEQDQVEERAMALAADVARGAVLAQASIKRLVDGGVEGTLAAGLVAERTAFAQIFHTTDSQIGVRSFLEHGPGAATFTGA